MPSKPNSQASKADILKVAHHGSETASTDALISAVVPRFALISASTNHHLPRETVVQRYEQSGAIVLRTDVSRQAGDDAIGCSGGPRRATMDTTSRYVTDLGGWDLPRTDAFAERLLDELITKTRADVLGNA